MNLTSVINCFTIYEWNDLYELKGLSMIISLQEVYQDSANSLIFFETEEWLKKNSTKHTNS